MPDGPGAARGKEQADMAEHCWNCATPLRWSVGTGAFCPNPACDVVDALDPGATYEVHIRLDHTPERAERPLTEAARAVARRELAPQG
jgi:hypothetical protein